MILSLTYPVSFRTRCFFTLGVGLELYPLWRYLRGRILICMNANLQLFIAVWIIKLGDLLVNLGETYESD